MKQLDLRFYTTHYNIRIKNKTKRVKRLLVIPSDFIPR
jgi:hypothetical protein